jgi:NAD(P) transhydrogenase subunit alpha
MVKAMKPGSVIVDMAAGKGPAGPHGGAGNCPLTEAGQTVVQPRRDDRGRDQHPRARGRRQLEPVRAQRARFPEARARPKDAAEVQVPMDDDIVVACLMTQGGEVRRK